MNNYLFKVHSSPKWESSNNQIRSFLLFLGVSALTIITREPLLLINSFNNMVKVTRLYLLARVQAELHSGTDRRQRYPGKSLDGYMGNPSSRHTTRRLQKTEPMKKGSWQTRRESHRCRETGR